MVRLAVAVAGVILAAGAYPASASRAPDPKGVEHHSDFGVTLSGPKEASVEGRATYEMEITNSGPDATEVKLRFNRGKNATAADFDDGDSIRTVSQDASQGNCVTDAHGVICKPGALAVGETVDVEVVMKIFDDYAPKVTVQATVAPELVPAFDTNHDNDHETADDHGSRADHGRRPPRELREAAVQGEDRDGRPEGEEDEGARRRQGPRYELQVESDRDRQAR